MAEWRHPDEAGYDPVGVDARQTRVCGSDLANTSYSGVELERAILDNAAAHFNLDRLFQHFKLGAVKTHGLNTMKNINIFSVSLISLIICTAPSAAPEANYIGTCQNIVLEYTHLKATCATVEGTLYDTEINLDDYISDELGYLTWSNAGGFSKTCTRFILDRFRYLGAERGDKCKFWKTGPCSNESKIDLTEKIINSSGELKIRRETNY